MAFKTFAPGVLTSSDVNTFLMRQAVITCTSSTRPASPSEGMTIYETDTDAYAVYDGSNWVYQGYWENFTPAITGLTLGNGSVLAEYATVGNIVFYRGRLVCGSTTTLPAAPDTLEISLPVTASIAGIGSASNGTSLFFDDSTGNFFTGTCKVSTSTVAGIHYGAHNQNAVGVTIGAWNTTDRPVTIDVDDSFSWFLVYKAA